MVYTSISNVDRLINRVETTNPEKFLIKDDLEVYKNLFIKEDKERMIAARVLLNMVLNHVWPNLYNMQSLKKNIDGKPFIKGLKGTSISHSDKIVAVAVSENSQIGIDIQKIGTMTIDDFGSELTVLEKKTYTKLGDEEKKKWLYDTWTLKESVVKADGIGISGIEQVQLDKENKTALLNGKAWHFKKAPNLQDYSLALCVDYKSSDVVWLNQDSLIQ